MNRTEWETHITTLVRDLGISLKAYQNCVGDELGNEIRLLKEQIELANSLIECPEILHFGKCGSGKYCNYCKYVKKYK